MKKEDYQKFVYWFEDGLLERIEEYLKKERIKLYRARERPCEILFYRRSAALCAPGVWSRACRRQGSWYRESDRSGQFLLTMNARLPESLGQPTCRITIEKLHPPERATTKDAQALVDMREFQEKIPGDWDYFTDSEKEALLEYLSKEKVSLPFKDVFLFYSANHANFVKPKFFITTEDGIAPCSIAETPLLCSACVELFGILGLDFKRCYVRKCPGLYYVDLEENDFFKVERC